MSSNNNNNSKKFLTVLLLTIFLLSLSVNACEKACRVGISTSFSNAYKKELKVFFDELASSINIYLFDNVDLSTFTTNPDTKSEQFKTDIRTAIDSEVSHLYDNSTDTFPDMIENAIFEQDPKFKGQCQHPYRVDQPPDGVRWKDEDCVKMDYICGNPPSICHHMDSIVKPRNVLNVKNLIESDCLTAGPFENDLVDTVVSASRAKGLSSTNSQKFGEATRPNIRTQLKTFANDVKENFCSNNNCEQYDAQIKHELLGYP